MTKHNLLVKRHRLDKLVKNMGITAISIASLFLFIFTFSIIIQAIPAFSIYKIKINLESLKEIQELNTPEYGRYFSDENLNQLNNLTEKSINIELLASSELNDYLKGHKSNFFNEQDRIFIDKLKNQNAFIARFNWGFFFNSESRYAELAGIATAVVGSVYTVIICLLFSIPIAVCSAIYLEEFAPKNLFTSLIEVNINNLAAIPSIVFGLLGLTVLVNFFDLQRSTAIVAGITLAMMVLPIMIISTRQALSTIPITVKHAALALGATKIQVIFHHSLPLALPGIMTGVILSLARAIGETAPLILIGMVAFIVDIPHSVFDPATVMPVQVFLWTQNPENAFHAKTAAAILVLLCILIILNIIAVIIRKKYEHRW